MCSYFRYSLLHAVYNTRIVSTFLQLARHSATQAISTSETRRRSKWFTTLPLSHICCLTTPSPLIAVDNKSTFRSEHCARYPGVARTAPVKHQMLRPPFENMTSAGTTIVRSLGHQLVLFAVENSIGAFGTKTISLTKGLAKQMQRVRYRPYSRCVKLFYDRVACHVQQALHNMRHFLIT